MFTYFLFSFYIQWHDIDLIELFFLSHILFDFIYYIFIYLSIYLFDNLL